MRWTLIMDKQSIIEYLELAAIIISGGLGIASALTETKNKKGKLTIWGILVVIGILIANTFSYLQAFLKQKKEATDREVAYKEQKSKDSTQLVQYNEQVKLLIANVKKSDSSLKQQLSIQKRSGIILNQVKQSMNVQHKIFDQSENLVSQQKTVVKNMDRTLYPLLPFKINLTLYQKVDDNSFALIAITQILKDKIKEIKDLTGSANSIGELPKDKWDKIVEEGIVPVFPGKKNYLVTNKNINHKLLMQLFSGLTIRFSFLKNSEQNNQLAINCEIIKDYLSNINNFKNVNFGFEPDNDYYIYTLEDLPVMVTTSLQTGAYSLQDISNTIFNLEIENSRAFIKNSDILFKFPPDFSRLNQIKNKGPEHNIFTKYNTYTYSYSAQSQFVY